MALPKMESSKFLIPRRWLEGRLQETEPAATIAAIEELAAEQERLRSLSFNLPRLSISYYRRAVERSCDCYGLSATELFGYVEMDFQWGVSISQTRGTTRDGRPKVGIWGGEWKLVVRPQEGTNSGLTLAVFDSLERVIIPTNRSRFAPIDVSFHPIWDEVPSDPRDWLREYQACKMQSEDAEREVSDLKRLIQSALARRKERGSMIARELRTPKVDDSVQHRRNAHAAVRRRYSALRIMMSLLRLRSERDRYCFSATIATRTKMRVARDNGVADNEYLWLRVDDLSVAERVEEQELLEIHSGNGGRPRRARIQSVSLDSGSWQSTWICQPVSLPTRRRSRSGSSPALA
jgi:hypothetical protein